MVYYIGTSGYSYGEWVRRFYPERLNENEWLKYYSERFNTVEINSSYYRFPFPNMVKGWYNKTPRDFKFTLKANRIITHVKRLKNVKEYLNNFYKLCDILGEKLSCILYQLPPNLKKDSERLGKFLKIVNKKYNPVFEFRHESWYCDEIYKILKENNASLCIVSGLDMKPVIKTTNRIAYFRFHGPTNAYSSCYSEKELKSWVRKIRNIKTKEKFAYFNNDTKAYAVKNAIYIKRLLRK